MAMHNCVIINEDIIQHPYLTRIAERFGLDFCTHESQGDDQLVLQYKDNILQLVDPSSPKLGGVFVDFCSDAMSYRRAKGGGHKEFIAKAIGVKGNYSPSVIDATAGLGRDAFLLANLGCHVTMIERSPVVAALLFDGLERAKQDAELGQWIGQRLTLLHSKSHQALAEWQDIRPDVVYMDPMFPHRKKSAAVKKEMKLFQQLLGHDADADEMLCPALALATKRVVVKRPASAPFLADEKPNSAITSKKHRFDVYFTHIKRSQE